MLLNFFKYIAIDCIKRLFLKFRININDHDHEKNNCIYAGVFAAWETTGSKKIWKAMLEMGEANEWKPGPRLQHADDHAICQTYIDIYRIEKDEKMIVPFRKQMDMLMATPYETSEIRPITGWWCDALFMAPPALVKLGLTLNEEKYLDFNDKLFKAWKKHGLA